MHGIHLDRIRYPGAGRPPGIHPWAVDLQRKCLRADSAARKAQENKRKGFRLNLIIGHPGWEELIAIKDVFPDVPILHQLEFVYQLTGADRGFDPEFAAEATESSEHLKSAKGFAFDVQLSCWHYTI